MMLALEGGKRESGRNASRFAFRPGKGEMLGIALFCSADGACSPAWREEEHPDMMRMIVQTNIQANNWRGCHVRIAQELVMSVVIGGLQSFDRTDTAENGRI
jgi:hypothetical protein